MLVTMPVGVGAVFGATGEGIDVVVEVAGLPIALAFVVLAAVVGLWVGRVTRMPSPAILGPLAVASLLALLPVFSDVAATQVLRLLIVMTSAPFVAAALRRRNPGPGPSDEARTSGPT